MPDEFVGPAERGAEHFVLGEHHRRAHRAALEQPAAAEGLHFVGEAEGAGPGQVVPERFGGDVPGAGLPADERVAPFDGGSEPEALGG